MRIGHYSGEDVARALACRIETRLDAADTSVRATRPTRREALRAMGGGFGMTALAAMLGNSALGATNPWAAKQPHFAPKAKHVIFVFLTGGLSAIDSFDH